MGLAAVLAHASGISAANCHCLALRYDRKWGFQSDFGESWVVRVEQGKVFLDHGLPGWLTGLWRSDSGAVYVSDSSRAIWMNPAPSDPRSPWKLHRVSGFLRGVWGLNDEFVVTWGLSGRDEFLMYRWNGKSWAEMPSPGDIYAVHGLAPDLLYAVGNQGLISRWDGHQWTRVRSPTRTILSSVFVVNEDEMYAVGAGQRVLEGSSHGWSEVAYSEEAMYGVAKLGNRVWIGATSDGLIQLQGNRLVVKSAKASAEHLEARGDALLVSCPDFIAETKDGESFQHRTDAKAVLDLMAEHPPLWLRRG